MWAAGVSCLGIVDEADGRLVAGLSSSNLRGLGRSRVAELLRPVLEFIRSRSPPDQPAATVLAVSRETKVEDAVQQATLQRVHRVWVVDADSRPLDVITFSDVLSLFLPRQSRAGRTPSPASMMTATSQPV